MKIKGPWSEDQVERFLNTTTVPLRLACNGTSGFPVLASLWFMEAGGRLWCATQHDADVVSLLERDPNCAFEVSVESPPYFGVRGQARATVHTEQGEDVLRQLMDRYLDDDNSSFAQFLLDRVDGEVAIELAPEALVTWDFRKRMRAA